MKLKNNNAIIDFLVSLYESIYTKDIDEHTVDPFNYCMHLPIWHRMLEQKQKEFILSLNDKKNTLKTDSDEVLSIKDDRIRLYIIAASTFKEKYFPDYQLSFCLGTTSQELFYNFKRVNNE